jgi:hypothetical protein
MSTPLAIGAIAALAAASQLSKRRRSGSPALSLEQILAAAEQAKKAAPRKARTPKKTPSRDTALHPLLKDNIDFIQLHRCVLAVYEKQTNESLPPHARLDQAFAICVASLQRNGYLVGRKPTGAGVVRSGELARDADALDRERRYQELKVLAKQSRRVARQKRKTAPKQSKTERELKRKRRGAANKASGKLTKKKLKAQIQGIRDAMEPVFSCDTVWGDCKDEAPSAGHCFMASMAVQDMLGGQILFGKVATEDGDISHYWNQIGDWQVDVTGDQFREPEIQIERGEIRESLSNFDRERYEWLSQDFNKEPMKIYERFRKRLSKELSKSDLCDIREHLLHMDKQ